jgi:NAD(P)-dependent dehydrogenase (short-subunit alcohol dehydrogenase family)
MSLNGKVVMITGASGGLGRAVVPAFANAGARTVTIDRQHPAHRLSGQLALAGDVTDEGDVKRLVAEVISKGSTASSTWLAGLL